MELCKEVYRVYPNWDYRERFYTNYISELDKYEIKKDFYWVATPYEQSFIPLGRVKKWANEFKRQEDTKDWFKGFLCPAFSVDYLLSKVRNYEFTIVNLNTSTLSLTSDSLNDHDGAILGEELDILLMEFILALKEEGNEL
jgi:hypothetical protein